MKAFFAICCITLSFHTGIGQQLRCYEGSLVLKNNSVLKAQVAIQPADDKIVFKSGDQLKVYTADKIQSLSFNGITADYLYEVVVYGEIKILRRPILPIGDLSDPKNGYHYFVYANNELIALSKFNRKVFPELLRNSETLFRFVAARRLNPNRRADIIKIVAYYNGESRQRSLLASRWFLNTRVFFQRTGGMFASAYVS